MKPILVTYATMAGSTAEVAEAIAGELRAAGLPVEVAPMVAVGALDDYSAVVAGGPMIVGWHRQAAGFLRRHRRDWARLPLAVFVTAISLTATTERTVAGVPVFVDEQLPSPATAGGLRVRLRQSHAQLRRYVKPILAAAGASRPRGVGVFGGRLEYGRLKPWAVLFVMGVIRAPAGDRRNWEAIHAWAAALPAALGVVPEPVFA